MEILNKMLAASICMIDFFCKSTAAITFCYDRKPTLRRIINVNCLSSVEQLEMIAKAYFFVRYLYTMVCFDPKDRFARVFYLSILTSSSMLSVGFIKHVNNVKYCADFKACKNV